jgi:hypothetical protein
MPPVPRYIEKQSTDSAGLVAGAALPYHLQPVDVLRTVEDLHELLHDVNSLLHGRGYDRMEELLDPAGYSGFISRTVVDRIARLYRRLVRNTYHNGYPDLLPRGVYPNDSAQHGSVRASGAVKLREGAVWIDPAYAPFHQERLLTARRDHFRVAGADDLLTALRAAGAPLRLDDIVAAVAPIAGVPSDRLRSTVDGVLKKLVATGTVHRPARGLFAA